MARPSAIRLWCNGDSIPPNEYGDIATIGAVDGHTACEALYDAPSAQLLLSLFESSAVIGNVRFVNESGALVADRRHSPGLRRRAE